MKTLSIALTTLPLLAVGAALAETPVVPQDEDLLTPHDRVLSRNPHLNPGWTWMTEPQAIHLLKARGFSDVFRIEKAGSSWRGKARKDYLSYHVAIDRYTRLVSHLDKKSRESYAAVAEKTNGGAAKTSKIITTVVLDDKDLITPQARLLSRNPHLHPGWTWMTESQAICLLKARGFSNIFSLEKAGPIWRGQALKDRASYHVSINRYADIVAHTDKKIHESYAVAERTYGDAAKVSKTITPVVLDDKDLLPPHERALSRNPHLYPEWTWMTESQAIRLLQARGFSDVLSLEKAGPIWRGQALKDRESYHVAINRYADIVAHMDKKSRESYAVAQKTQPAASKTRGKKRGAAKDSKTMLATLNGRIAAPISQEAPTVLTPGKPVLSMMGEIGWTWMKEKHAKLMLKSKGYANIVSLRRDARGIWRAMALRDGFALNVAVDIYGNVEAQPESRGGLAQGSLSY
jgi:hypothetical protein